MSIHIAQQKESWNEWFIAKGKAHFLQSWEWGDFQERVGKPVRRLQVRDGDDVIAQVQGFRHDLGFGLHYIYMPRVHGMHREILDELKKEGFSFARVEPVDHISDIEYQVAPAKNRQPQVTLVLDVSKTDDELLAGMHSKTRYNIRLAGRKGIEIKEDKNIDWFWAINEETSERDAFKTHDKEYYAEMLKLDMVHQFTAFFEDKPIASTICTAFGDTFTYVHGASSNQHRNVMAPYLLQWKGIKKAKLLGRTRYDFWGIAPQVEEQQGVMTTSHHQLTWEATHPWTGITRFKAGFGGSIEIYPAAVEIPLKTFHYWLFSLAKKIRG